MFRFAPNRKYQSPADGEGGDTGVTGGHPGAGSNTEPDAGGQGDPGQQTGDAGTTSTGGDAGLLSQHHQQQGKKEGGADTGDHATGRPEGVPEQFWDAEKGELRSDSLVKAWKDTRTSLEEAQRKLKDGAPPSQAPKTAEEYQFKPPEGIEIPDDDPVMKGFREAAFDAGLSQEQAEKVFNAYVEQAQALAGPPLDPEKEKERIGPNADAVIRSVYEWGKQLKEHGVWSDDEFNEIILMGSTAEGIRALNKMRQHYGGGEQIPTQSAPADGLPSEEELYAMVGDPKYGADPAYTEKVDGMFKRFYGDNPAGSSPRGKGVPRSSSHLAAWSKNDKAG